MDRLVGNKVECNGCTWSKACNALTWCPSDQQWAGCRKKDEKQVWTGLLLASIKFLQAFASQKTRNTQVTLVSSIGLHLTVCLSTLPVTLLDLLWTVGNGTLKDLKQINSFVHMCVCVCVCTHTHIHIYTHTRIYMRTYINAHKEQNSVNWTGKVLDRCQIIGYSRLSESNSTDWSSYRFLFLLLLLHLGCTMHSGVLLAEEVDGVGGKGSEDITMVEVETILEVFLGTQNCEKWLLAPPYLSVSLPMELLSSHWTHFHEIWYLSIFFLNLLKNFTFH